MDPSLASTERTTWASHAKRRATSAGIGPTPSTSATCVPAPGPDPRPKQNQNHRRRQQQEGGRGRGRGRTAQEQLERCVHDDPGPHGWTASQQRRTPYTEQPHHRVVETLVIGHVTKGIQFVGIGFIRGIGSRRYYSPLVGSDSGHERRLRGGVVVRREGDPHGPPRVVEAQRAALELPDGRASTRSPSGPERSVPRSASPVTPAPSAPSSSAVASLCARCHATNSRAWRTLQ